MQEWTLGFLQGFCAGVLATWAVVAYILGREREAEKVKRIEGRTVAGIDTENIHIY